MRKALRYGSLTLLVFSSGCGSFLSFLKPAIEVACSWTPDKSNPLHTGQGWEDLLSAAPACARSLALWESAYHDITDAYEQTRAVEAMK